MSPPPVEGDARRRDDTVVAEFEPHATAVRAARRFVRANAGVDPQQGADLELVTSELATNAVLHARTPFEVRVLAAPDCLRVEVTDRSPTLPVIKDHGTEAPTGRGLKILDAIADRWGVEPTDGGKVVWFEVDLADPDLAEHR